MPLKTKPTLEEEYFSLQKQFEEAGKQLGGSTVPSAPTSGSLFDRIIAKAREISAPTLGKEALAGAGGAAMFLPKAAAQHYDLTRKLGPTLGPLIGGLTLPYAGLSSLYQSVRGTPGPAEAGVTRAEEGIRSRIGLPKEQPGLLTPSGAANLLGNLGAFGAAGAARRGVSKAAEAAVSPVARNLGKPGPVGTIVQETVPNWLSELAHAKPKIKMPVESAKGGLKEAGLPRKVPKALRTPKPITLEGGGAKRDLMQTAPKEQIDAYLDSFDAPVSVKAALKNAYNTGGQEAMLDMAQDLAEQGKLIRR